VLVPIGGPRRRYGRAPPWSIGRARLSRA